MERPDYDADNTVYPLGRPGLVERFAASADPSLNGPGKPYLLPSALEMLPETIADHLLDSKAGSRRRRFCKSTWNCCGNAVAATTAWSRSPVSHHDFIDTHERC